MNVDDLPLFQLFTQLQNADLPLGLSEYELLIKALRSGFGVADQRSLKQLCQTLWIKNQDEEQIFNYHFSELFEPESSISSAEQLGKGSRLAEVGRNFLPQILLGETKKKLLLGGLVLAVGTGLIFGGNRLWKLSRVANLEGTASTDTDDFEEANETPSVETGDADGGDSSTSVEQNSEQDAVTDTDTELDQRLPESQPAQGNEPNDISEDSIPVIPVQDVTEEEVKRVFFSTVGLLALVMLLGTGGTWLLVHYFVRIPQDKQPETLNELDSSVIQRMESQQQVLNTLDDEIQFADAIQAQNQFKAKTPKHLNTQVGSYLPLTQRQMKQAWRRLRISIRQGPKTELDLEGTVHQIAHQGGFIEPVMQAGRSNRTDLVFLMDQDGSMVPFQSLGRRFVETALRAGRLGRTSTYYFRNCPAKYVYCDPLMQMAESIEHLLTQRLTAKSVVVIFSDAGSARNNFNPSRIRKTQAFLELLKHRVQCVVWLNPLPAERWPNTTSSEIAKTVAMFEANRQGFQSAVEVLRGKWKVELAAAGR